MSAAEVKQFSEECGGCTVYVENATAKMPAWINITVDHENGVMFDIEEAKSVHAAIGRAIAFAEHQSGTETIPPGTIVSFASTLRLNPNAFAMLYPPLGVESREEPQREPTEGIEKPPEATTGGPSGREAPPNTGSGVATDCVTTASGNHCIRCGNWFVKFPITAIYCPDCGQELLLEALREAGIPQS